MSPAVPRIPRRLLRILLLAVGAYLVFVIFADLLLEVIPPLRPADRAEALDPLRQRHEVLKRSSPEYSLRLNSVRRLREAGLAGGNPLAVEDEVLTAARELLRSQPVEEAEAVATRRLVLMAPQVTIACGRAGIVLGPNILPELIRARLQRPDDQKRLGQLIADYQFAELVRTLVRAQAEAAGAPAAEGE
jgi:hypothetical protein